MADDALKASVAPGPAPVKAAAALKVAEPLLSAPVEGHDFPITAVQGAAQKRGFRWRRPRHTLKGRQDPDAIDRVGLRLKLRKAQAEAGDLVLLFSDESEALTHPYLARAWAKRGADLRVPAPGQSKKVAMMGTLAWTQRKLIVDNGPIHVSKATRAALAERAHWLTVEWLPKYAPELKDIEVVWGDLKAHQPRGRRLEFRAKTQSVTPTSLTGPD